MSQKSLLLNVGLVILGILAIVLIYSFIDQTMSPHIDPKRVSNPTGLEGELIQVEVLNANGTDGIAGTIRNYLFERGFDVVEVGNHESQEEAYTIVIDRTGEKEHANRIAKLLGVPDTRIKQQVNPDYYLDVSVIVGKDYDNLTPFTQ